MKKGKINKEFKEQLIETAICEFEMERTRIWDREEGREEQVIFLIQKKAAKGKTLDVIADELETTVDGIKPIYDEVLKHSYDSAPTSVLCRLTRDCFIDVCNLSQEKWLEK